MKIFRSGDYWFADSLPNLAPFLQVGLILLWAAITVQFYIYPIKWLRDYYIGVQNPVAHITCNSCNTVSDVEVSNNY